MSMHCLCVGNNYSGTSSALAGCVNDACDTAAEFKPWCATSTVLIENRADRHGVFKAGKILLDRLEPGDLGLLSISGHGTRERGSKGFVEALVFADFELGYDYEWAELLGNRAKGSFLAVFADCCHSGGFARGNHKPKTIPLSRCRRHKMERAGRDKALPDVVYFSGCKTDEYAFDGNFDGRPEGAMTHYLLKAWRELKQTNTFKQLFNRLAGKRPKGYLPDDEYDQTPTFVGSNKNMGRTFKSFIKGAA